nr:MAG TPA: hypothetical protein [Caudoviricetes sp.]
MHEKSRYGASGRCSIPAFCVILKSYYKNH